MKKIVPDPPVESRLTQFRNAERDLATALMRNAMVCRDPDAHFLESLTTTHRHIGDNCLFAVREGASSEEALLHVSLLLKCAEEVSDEISEQNSGVERGLIWSMIHAVEMARAVVDSLLDSRRLSKPETPPV